MTLAATVGRLMGVHFHTVPSALVAETPDGVEAVEPVELGLFKRMLGLHLPGASAVAATLLATRGHLESLAGALERLAPGAAVVADPVYEAGAGGGLLADDVDGYLEAWARLLLPRARLAAVNAVEAERLTGIAIVDEESMLRAARRLVERGAWAAAVKGGHLGGDVVVDVYVDRLGRTAMSVRPRVESCPGGVHGLGCVFASTAAAALALGGDSLEAFHAASRAAWEAAAAAYSLGGGRCVADPARGARLAAGLLDALRSVFQALRLVWENWRLLEPLVPETGMNIVEAPGEAREPGEVVGVEGRVTRGLGRPVHGCPAPGASSHMARLVLALRRQGVQVSAAVNARPLPELLEAAGRLGLRVLRVDRSREPSPDVEGGTMEWMASQVAAAGGADMVYDTGAVGKEPMLRVLAPTAVEAVAKLVRAAREARLSR